MIPIVCVFAMLSISPSSALQVIVEPTSIGNHRVGAIKVGSAGFACTVDGRTSPASYPVTAIGESGVPAVSAPDVALAAKMFRISRPRGLRFSYVRNTFVVFNAPVSVREICSFDTPPFAVWNGACNEYYSPLLGQIQAANACDHPLRPWILNDKGIGSAPWTNIVH